MARTNVYTTAKRIRRQVGNGHREENGVLFATIDDTVNTLQFTTAMPASVHEGVTLGIDAELILVVTADPATNICTVIRGFEDSIAAAHLAGTMIEIAPRFPLFSIVEAMISEVDSWGPDLYYADTQLYTVADGVTLLGLTGVWYNIYRVLDVKQEEVTGDFSVWPRIRHRLVRGGVGSNSPWAPTTGIGIRFQEPVRGGRVAITAAIPFPTDVILADSDWVTTVHLTKSQVDLLEMGTKIRLIMDSDDEATGRNAQDEPRRAAEVPIGSMVSLSQLRLARYTRRLSDEKAKLNRLFPTRMS